LETVAGYGIRWNGGGAKLLFVLSVASADATICRPKKFFEIFFLSSLDLGDCQRLHESTRCFVRRAM
jgi:hypothetical protein